MASVQFSDIFSFPPESPRYSDTALEIRDRLPILIQKLDCLMCTEQGSLIGVPDFGINLEKYIFETGVNANFIKNEIDKQIMKYVTTNDDAGIRIDVEVNFYDNTANDISYMCIVDMYIDSRLVSSYMY